MFFDFLSYISSDLDTETEIQTDALTETNRGQTAHSLKYIQLTAAKYQLEEFLIKSDGGRGRVLFVLDSGIDPDHKSFSGENFDPPPPSLGEFGEPGFSNNKLVGAKHYKNFLDKDTKLEVNNLTPLDCCGHGTQCASIAVGNNVDVPDFGFQIRGVAPNARLGMCKILWKLYESSAYTDYSERDVLIAFHDAIKYGADVISFSAGSYDLHYTMGDAVSMGGFMAITNSILPVCASGNQLESYIQHNCIMNYAPWLLTVGASEIPRFFKNHLVLGDGTKIEGIAIPHKLGELPELPLILASDAKKLNMSDESAMACEEHALDPKKVAGKVILCKEYACLESAYKLGAKGCILYSDSDDVFTVYGMDLGEFNPTTDPIPTSRINLASMDVIQQYMQENNNPTVKITRGDIVVSKDECAAFSLTSRGPAVFFNDSKQIYLDFIKPDIVAPGVNVIAASIDEKTRDPRHISVGSGTSLSCPYVGGGVLCLQNIHPSWNPAALKSSIMTTANPNVVEGVFPDGTKYFGLPICIGSGQVDFVKAMDPGLIYNLEVSEYLDFLYSIGFYKSMTKYMAELKMEGFIPTGRIDILNFNYPSISIPNVVGSQMVVSRRVKKVFDGDAVFVPLVKVPSGVICKVEPTELKFEGDEDEKTLKLVLNFENEDQCFKADLILAFEGYIDAYKSNTSSNESRRFRAYGFGELVWTDGVHKVRSPIMLSRELQI